jgi:hypothetical protein
MRRWILVIALQLGFTVARAASVQALPDATVIGQPESGANAIVESVAQIMARQPARDAADALRKPRRSRGHKVDLSQREIINAPQVANWPVFARAGLSDDRAPQIVSTPNFTGATLADANAVPPDTMGAVGPTQFIVMINGRIRSFNKTTGAADGVLNASTDSFFNTVITPGGAFTTDPRIRFDRLINRWIVVMIDAPDTAIANRVMIGISSGANITAASNFSFFQFRVSTTLFADYPTLGIDNNALYIGSNYLRWRTRRFSAVAACRLLGNHRSWVLGPLS